MKTKLVILAAAAAFLIPLGALALNTPALNGINTPAQWIPNSASSTITPNPNTLQVPCANIVGGCGSGGGGISTGTVATLGSPLTIQGNATATISGTAGTPSVIPNLNNIVYVPTNFATAGCAGSSTATTFQGCVQALYLAAASTGAGTQTQGVTFMVTQTVPSSTFTGTLNLNDNFFVPSIQCSAGVTINYGGSGYGVIFNFGDPSGHVNSFDTGCWYRGQGNIIAGQTNNQTTTGIKFGGSAGAVNINFQGNSIGGFGTDIEDSSNSYMMLFQNNAIFGWNGSIGNGVIIDHGANSGEDMQWLNNTFTDPGNSTTTGCAIQFSDSSVADAYISGGSVDDAKICAGLSIPLVINHVHFENSDAAGYPSYPYVVMSPSSASSLVLTNNTFDNDAVSAGASPAEFVEEAVGQVYAAGNYLDKFGNQAVPLFIDHSTGPSIPNETLCGNWNQNNAVTAFLNQTGGANTANCWTERANAYPVAIQSNGNSVATIINGPSQQVDATFDSNGNWTFLNNVATGGTVTVPSTSTSYIANLDTTYYVPTNFNSVGCAGNAGATDFGACVQAIYNSVSTSTGASSVQITVPVMNIPSSEWMTGVNFNRNGLRADLYCAPGEGTTLNYGGSGAGITLNYGIQSAGVSHTIGEGVYGCNLIGTNTSTSSPQIGILAGGTNGAAGTVVNNVDLNSFGIGLKTATNTYNFTVQNSVIRNNGQNVDIPPASNSGESDRFLDDFIVDGANHNPNDCFYVDNSGASSLDFDGTSLDDCQLHILQANNVVFTGGHLENVGFSAWGAYDYIKIDQNLATNLDVNGTTFFNDAPTSTAPATFILNGGTLTLNGPIVREFGGNTVTSFVTTQGSGRTTWTGFNNVSGVAVSNVVDSLGISSLGSTGTSTFSGTLNVANQYYSNYFKNATSTTSSTSINWNNSNVQSLVLATATTISFSNVNAGGRYLLGVLQDGTGSRLVTWPSTIQWAGGTAPTLTTAAGKMDIITFVCMGVSSSDCYAGANLNYQP